MINRRKKPDGLPFRLYERMGVRVYSIGYKGKNGKWEWRMECAAGDAELVRETRREAISKANRQNEGGPVEGTFGALGEAWFAWQEKLPEGSAGKRAASTIAENKREFATLKKAFGEMAVAEMEKGDAYEYLDACLVAVDKDGNPRPRPAKGNKEISLAQVILEYGVRIRLIKKNPFEGVDKLPTVTKQHSVEPHEMDLAVEVGRMLGGPQLVVALACKTAYLCVRRSVEVRDFTRPQITDEGIVWTGGKRRSVDAERKVLIEWTPVLRKTIDEALAIERGELAAVWYIFGTQRGQKYTRGGWKKTLSVLMDKCVEIAAQRGIPFRRFSLQDCRPMGVTAKAAKGHKDVQDATLHTNKRMIDTVYDRRKLRVAKPAE